MSDLTKYIDQLVTDKTFSLDGLAAIQNLRSKAEEQEKKIDRLVAAATTDQATISRITAERDALKSAEATLAARTEAVTAREAKIFEHEKTAATANASYSALQFAFQTVFRNTVTRESVNKAVVAGQGGYPQSFPETTTRQTEPDQQY